MTLIAPDSPAYIMKSGYLTLPWGQMNRRVLRYGWWFGLIAILFGVSCKRDSREELFELNYPPPPIVFDILPGLNTVETHIYTITPIPSKYLERLAASGRTSDEVTAIEAKEAYLSGIFQDDNLDYIHRVSVHIFDPFNPSDKIEFFYMDPVPPKDKTTIRLFPGIADISDWVTKEFFGIEIRLDFRQISPTLTQMKFEFDLRAMGS